MKISNWCRKLATALVAGGLIVPTTARAIDVNRNLIINGDFEHVDLAITGNYHGPKILDWTGPSMFAYSHDNSSSNSGIVPDYSEGGPLAGGGHWYFSSNNTGTTSPGDIQQPNVFFQDINIPAGDVQNAIAAGRIKFQLRAYMSSYANDGDYGLVRLDFSNAEGISAGTLLMRDLDAGSSNVWSLNSTTALAVPTPTRSIRVSIYGTAVNGGADGFIDNVSLILSGPPGDYNLNGTVDAADYTVWRNSLGSTSASRADGSGSVAGVPDGVVNRLDYDFWTMHYGESFGSGAGGLTSVERFSHQAVPEPASLVLMCVATGAAFCFFAARNGKA